MTLLATASRWIVAASLFSLTAVAASVSPGHSQTGGTGGSPGSPGGPHEPSKPTKPKLGATSQSRLPDKPGLRIKPQDQAPLIEERLQRGQMEEAVAQGQISDRLEQFHKNGPEGASR